MEPGKVERLDFEYERKSICYVSMAFEPLAGWRQVSVTERRRKQEFAEAVRYLAEDIYPEPHKIRLVVDNLSTHSPAAFYETFSPEQARRLARRVEFVYTPVHGSWAKHGGSRALRVGETMPQETARLHWRSPIRGAGLV